MRAKILFLFPVLVVIATVQAQSPAPVIVQPANAAPATATKMVAAGADSQSVPGALKVLEQIKAANAEALAKQKAALEKLDELQDAADQLRIFAKRG